MRFSCSLIRSRLLLVYGLSVFILSGIAEGSSLASCKVLSNPLQDQAVDAATVPATELQSDGSYKIADQAPIYGGQIVDSTKFRPIQILQVEGEAGSEGSFLKVTNYHHNGGFYTAIVPLGPKAVDRFITQVMPLPIVDGILAGHVQGRFIMNPQHKIKLLDTQTEEMVEEVDDLIVSYEAAYPEGASYNFAIGAIDANPLVASVGSGKRSVQVSPGRPIRQFQTPIEGLFAARLLSHFLNDAHQIQMNLFYNTISPNCTTKIFDGIDVILQQMNQAVASRFLTVIGGDPVIGPAINALLDRFSDQVVEIQQMQDEILSGARSDLGVPQRVAQKPIPFAAVVDGRPMTLVIDQSDFEQRDGLNSDLVLNALLAEIPGLMTNLLDASQSLSVRPEMAIELLRRVNVQLTERLKNLDLDRIGRGSIRIFFAPYPELEGASRDLSQMGVRAELAFPYLKIDRQADGQSLNSTRVLQSIQQGLDRIGPELPDEASAQLNALAVHIVLGEESSVESQIQLRIAPIKEALAVSNAQVEISEALIDPPSLDVLYSQRRFLDEDRETPTALIRFGPRVNVSPNPAQGGGLLSISAPSSSRYVCWSSSQLRAPILRGQLTSHPLGEGGFFKGLVNRFLKGRDVDLAITELEVDVESLEVKRSRVRIGVLGLRCIELDSVNDQLTEQMNSVIAEQLKGLLGNARNLRTP